MINVMSKADNKSITRGHGKYLDERHPLPDDQLPEKRNVEFQCGYASEFCWLPLC